MSVYFGAFLFSNGWMQDVGKSKILNPFSPDGRGYPFWEFFIFCRNKRVEL